MDISLNQDSDVPLRQQLSEQIVFLITTGELRAGDEMPSVRALARRASVHHNTVSKAYQELVRREWLTRKRGSRLVVGRPANQALPSDPGIDDLINETIRRAKHLGYSLQELRDRVRERLLEEPADHLLVVEQEPGLREILQVELEESSGWRIEGCSTVDLVREPGLAIGAQVLGPSYLTGYLRELVPVQRPCFAIQFANAAEQLTLVRALREPSIIAAASISASFLKTARSLLAPSIGREHTYRELLLSTDEEVDARGFDLVFCDSVALPLVSCQHKALYRLISVNCLEELSMHLSSEN